MPVPATTYVSLTADLKNYFARGSASDVRYNDQIPSLIQKAVERLGLECKSLVNRVPLQDALQAGVPVLTKPAYWGATTSFIIAKGQSFNTLKPLEPRTKEFINTYWEVPSDVAEPKFYGDYDQDRWIIGPTPDQPYPVEFIVDLQAEPLDESNTTNVYTEKAPDLLLAACLFEAEIFLNGSNPVKIAQREKTYDRVLSGYGGERVTQGTDRTEDSKA